jgi:hypothetical protein
VTVRIAVAVLVAAWLAGCASAPSLSPSASVATPVTTPVTTPPPGSATASTSAIAIDPSLLAVVPANVAGFAVTESPEAEASAASGPELPQVATGFAAGLAADPAGGDWVFVVVVALKPGVMSDAVFRSWRDSYDDGACSQAGGVGGHAEAELGGRKAFITSCGGGLRTYHVWLPSRQRLVSVSAVGARRFGEQLVTGIRE